ncbi:hypothetical protein [Mycobacterium heckeshornense]|nr:hypothetical protein [Mycobacterium heckeshornense]
MSRTSLEHDFRIESQLQRAMLGDREIARAEMCGGEWWIDVADEAVVA